MSYTSTDDISTINVNAKQKKRNKLKYLFGGLIILALLSLIGVLIYIFFFKCKDSGEECEETDDCCKNNICGDNNKCCIDVDKECKNNSDCCSNKCENDICVKECKKYNNNCTKNLDCCDDLVCNEGKCKNKCNNLNESCNMSENNCCDDLVCKDELCKDCDNISCEEDENCCDNYNCDDGKCIKSSSPPDISNNICIYKYDCWSRKSEYLCNKTYYNENKRCIWDPMYTPTTPIDPGAPPTKCWPMVDNSGNKTLCPPEVITTPVTQECCKNYFTTNRKKHWFVVNTDSIPPGCIIDNSSSSVYFNTNVNPKSNNFDSRWKIITNDMTECN